MEGSLKAVLLHSCYSACISRNGRLRVINCRHSDNFENIPLIEILNNTETTKQTREKKNNIEVLRKLSLSTPAKDVICIEGECRIKIYIRSIGGRIVDWINVAQYMRTKTESCKRGNEFWPTQR
jgi:hypothetical protein